MSEYGDEYATVWKETVRRARKSHVCSACRAVIQPGEFYVYHFDVYDGDVRTLRRCGACELTYRHLEALCDEHNRLNNDDLFPLPDLGCGKSYEHEWGDLPEEIAALAFMTSAERGSLLAPKESVAS